MFRNSGITMYRPEARNKRFKKKTSLYPRREENIWSELELNPGLLASQVTTLTTRPWLLGHPGYSIRLIFRRIWQSMLICVSLNTQAFWKKYMTKHLWNHLRINTCRKAFTVLSLTLKRKFLSLVFYEGTSCRWSHF